MTDYFRPPAHLERFALPDQDRLWSRVSYPRGNTVFNLGGGTIDPLAATQLGYETVTQQRIADVEALPGGRAYLGGHIYQLTAQETTDLTTAGYGAFISTTPP